ncbi:MAG: hypothetical protein RBR20_10090 [Desulfobacterales bacterium]|jgi:hypothetical protein|nr:hypothetical protein [Desulfobacteraceae bacterium]MDD3990868.1 hypothetical protein [Desulfobacteraceae bacterium]MDY0312460.1 hypothetical protein [Desulfobacterales bacterium]
MDRNNMSMGTAIVLVVLAGILVQVVLAFGDSRSMPHRTAIAFSKAYFQLDPVMGTFLCSDLRSDEEADPVALLRERRFDEARERGLSFGMMHADLYHVDSQTEFSEDGEQALVHITAARRTAINPVFAWVARLFSIGETHHLKETLELVKEEGEWKVCGNPFGLADLAT